MSNVSLNKFGDRMAYLMPKLMQEMWVHELSFFARSHVTLPQLGALNYLYLHRSCTMCALARAMHLRESTTTGLVDRMAKINLVKRVRSRTDRRVVTVSITNKGDQAMNQLQQQRRQGFISMFQRISASDRTTWLEIIEKLVRELSPDQTEDVKAK